MRREVIGAATASALLFGSLGVGVREAGASKPFKTVTSLACKKCHTSRNQKDMSDKDLTQCGKDSFEVLKKGGYKRGKDAEEQKAWAEKLLKDFKCKD